MLRNTVYILDRAEPCCGESNRAAEVVRQGTRLIFRLRWAQMVMLVHRDNETLCAITAETAERYAGLWSEVVGWVEAKFLQRRERPHDRSCRQRLGGRAAL
jgi:hypothetical protein